MTSFDPRTALVVVDVQNDFADPAGSLFVPGGDEVPAAVNRRIDAARAAGAVVVYTQDWHPPRTPHFTTGGGPWPPHCVRDTWGAQFVAGLQVAGPVVRKGTGPEDGYSGFTMLDVPTGRTVPTALDEVLRRHGITRVVVVGLAQDVCVKDTALDARRLGYDVVVDLEATRAVNLHDGDDGRANDELAAAGVTLTGSPATA